MQRKAFQILPGLRDYMDSLDPGDIPAERKEILDRLAGYLADKLDDQKIVLNFICTHNSRRSQFAQAWARVWSDNYTLDVDCVSGGIEVTAFNHRAVETLERAGFRIDKSDGENPKYTVWYSDQSAGIKMYSKMYDEAVTPGTPFAAVMTCAHADEQCPFIPGAKARFALDYEDPGLYDNTAEESSEYDARCRQIATEMKYVFSHSEIHA